MGTAFVVFYAKSSFSDLETGSVITITDICMSDVDCIYVFEELGDNDTTNPMGNIMRTSQRLAEINQRLSTDIDVDRGSLNRTEPIIIRGDGNLTIFGIFNRFSVDFPSKLSAKLAPEEYHDSINKINKILKKELSHNLKWFLFGSICCCCTLGCSLIPVIYMNKKAKLLINKLLMIENERLFKKLGLKWSLTKVKCNNSSLAEYVICIDIIDKIQLYSPD